MVWSLGTVLWEWETPVEVSSVHHWPCLLGEWDGAFWVKKKPGCNPDIKQAEFGYVADLNQFVQLHLDENEKYNSLAFYTVKNVTVAAMSIIVNVK